MKRLNRVPMTAQECAEHLAVVRRKGRRQALLLVVLVLAQAFGIFCLAARPHAWADYPLMAIYAATDLAGLKSLWALTRLRRTILMLQEVLQAKEEAGL